MNFSNKNILLLTDGSQGMISQVEGLAKKFSQHITHIETKLIFPWSKIPPGILPLFSWVFLNDLNLSFEPSIVISCGRKSVYLSIYLKKKYKNLINIHIQNPKVNFKNFNYIVAPAHDNINGENILISTGALHKFDKKNLKEISNNRFDVPVENLISVIVGGNNRHYKFNLNEANNLISKIKYIKEQNPQYNILVLFSRRTGDNVKKLLCDNLKNIVIIADEKNKDFYKFALKNSIFFIVTSDSTSMISECAFTGKPIYVFNLPFKRNSKRIKSFHEYFMNLRITRNLSNKNDLIPWSYKALNESERIAGILKERIIKEKS